MDSVCVTCVRSAGDSGSLICAWVLLDHGLAGGRLRCGLRVGVESLKEFLFPLATESRANLHFRNKFMCQPAVLQYSGCRI
jgi:hypothetical protein